METALPDTERTITSARIDDLPLLVGHFRRMGRSELLDDLTRIVSREEKL